MAKHQIQLEDHRGAAGGDYRLLTPAEARAITAEQARAFPVLAQDGNPIVAVTSDGHYLTAAGLEWHVAPGGGEDRPDWTA